MKEFTIGPNDAGQRLDRFLAKAVPLLPASLAQKYIRIKRIKCNGKRIERDARLQNGLLPASLAQKYIRIKRIKCNGKRIERDARLQNGDVLQLYINDEFFDKPRQDNAYLTVASPKLNIVYEDAHILLVDKRPGLAVHPHDGAEYGRTLIDHIQSYLYQKGDWKPRGENAFTPALCNRIDRNTGGIVIAAKTAMALRVMNQKIKDRELDKRYLAGPAGDEPKNQGPGAGQAVSRHCRGNAQAPGGQPERVSVQRCSEKPGVCHRHPQARFQVLPDQLQNPGFPQWTESCRV